MCPWCEPGDLDPKPGSSLLTAARRYPGRQQGINWYYSNGFSYQDLGRARAGWATTALLPQPRAKL